MEMEAYAQENDYTWRKGSRESEETDDTDSVGSYPDIASIGDVCRTAPGMLSPDIPGPSS